jgi:two-component system cell cycle response regulator DivK
MPTPRRVLIVEDNEVNYDLASAVLETMGLDVDWARDGEEGLDRALTHQCDLLILDLQIPKLPGRDVLRRLRQDPRTMNLPILVLTADAMQGTGDAVLSDGASAYLTKPFDLGVFRGTVAELLA